jgi:hypothetical protein
VSSSAARLDRLGLPERIAVERQAVEPPSLARAPRRGFRDVGAGVGERAAVVT